MEKLHLGRGDLVLDVDGLVSRSEWDNGKKGWEWLFPTIDANADGQIDPKEYVAFQVYKARNPDWMKKRPGRGIK